MKTETIMLGSMPAYIAFPESHNGRAVIVIQEAYGVNAHIEDVTRRFASTGHLGVAPALFHRTLEGTIPYGDFKPVMPHIMAATDQQVLEDADATLRFLHDQGVESQSTGVVGFCIGGRFTFLVAAKRPLGGAVSFYGGGIDQGRTPGMPSLLDSIPTMKTPWLGLFGDLDQSIPVENVEQLRAALQKDATVDTEIVRYADAGHGFHCDARPDSYVETAAKDGWARTLDWFETHLR
jgi:carboxymethylenebutenolidase